MEKETSPDRECARNHLSMQRRRRVKERYIFSWRFSLVCRAKERRLPSCVPDILMRHVNRCSISAERKERYANGPLPYRFPRFILLPSNCSFSCLYEWFNSYCFKHETNTFLDMQSLDGAVKTSADAPESVCLTNNDTACAALTYWEIYKRELQ